MSPDSAVWSWGKGIMVTSLLSAFFCMTYLSIILKVGTAMCSLASTAPGEVAECLNSYVTCPSEEMRWSLEGVTQPPLSSTLLGVFFNPICISFYSVSSAFMLNVCSQLCYKYQYSYLTSHKAV